jgi:site-specific recombinase XerC
LKGLVSKIRTKATSHSFRKSSATHMLKNGAPLVSVQALLGHKTPTTTEIYTKVYPKDIIQMHKGHHPRERQKNLRLEELRVPKWLYKDRPFVRSGDS